MNEQTPHYRYKVCLMGDPGVGKTSLVNRVTAGIFDERYLTTVGLRVETMRMQIGDRNVELGLWDLAGGVENRTLVRSGYAGAAGVFVVADPTKPHGLQSALEHLRWIRGSLPDALRYLILNKVDIKYAWLPENSPACLKGVLYFIASAKTGEGVSETFGEMARGLLAKSSPPGLAGGVRP